MKRILFLIHDLGAGGAEKVLVSLVNQLDCEKFDITVISLFGGGVNERHISPQIHYRTVWKKVIPGNSHLMKILTPRQLHKLCVKERYDVEVAYLEGPAARVISGCPYPETKLLCWIHSEQPRKVAKSSFRCFSESMHCYRKFDKIVCVSEGIRKTFSTTFPSIKNIIVRNNTIETNKICEMKDEAVTDVAFSSQEFNIITVGKLTKNKGIGRLAKIVNRLRNDGLRVHFYAVGEGKEQAKVEMYLQQNDIEPYFTFLGYRQNPYKYVSKCDLYVCASFAEGFSTAVTEALIVGTPVCTVKVSGMKELLGEHNQWGVVTDNDDEALYQGIRALVTDRKKLSYYQQRAYERGRQFSTENSVKAVEKLILDMVVR